MAIISGPASLELHFQGCLWFQWKLPGRRPPGVGPADLVLRSWLVREPPSWNRPWRVYLRAPILLVTPIQIMGETGETGGNLKG